MRGGSSPIELRPHIKYLVVNYDRWVHKSDVPSSYQRKVMIDGGFNIGKYTKAFLKKNPDFKVYAFEPIPFPTDVTNVTIIRKAMWTKNELKDFYLSRNSEAASLFKESRFVKPNKKMSVECINFGAWVLANFNKNDYIHLKLDIEGVECEILRSMISDGSIKLVSELVCEWHQGLSRIEGYTEQFNLKKSSIISDLKSLGHLRWLQDWR